jgi:post-segregation antitoxin (ccd killing protein)
MASPDAGFSAASIPLLDTEYEPQYDHIEGMRMNERITVTIPEEVVRDIDRRENNRSRFILQAVQNELERRRKEELRRSLRAPHPESERLAQAGADDWIASLPEGDIDLVDVEAGESVRWIPGQGWTKEA